MPFVHLRCHTSHSAFDGALTPKALAKGVKKAGMAAAAITDVGTTAGVIQWQKACEKEGIHPIYGMMVWLEAMNPTSRPEIAGAVALVDEPGSLLLYAKDRVGWENLSRLGSFGSRRVLGHPRVSWAELETCATGLQALLPFDSGRLDEDIADRLDRLYPNAWGLEVFDNGEGWEPSRRAERALWVARAPFGEVGTNAVRYLAPTDVVALHALRCVGLGAALDAPGWWVPTSDQAWLCPEDEMRARLGDGPVDASARFAETLLFSPKTKGYHFPKSEPGAELDVNARWAWLQDWFPLPADLRPATPIPFPDGAPEAPAEQVNQWCAITARIGLDARLAADPTLERAVYVERLEREIGMIREMGFSAYLLIVAEFIVWAKEAGIPVGPGRGSVAGSLVAWAMRITEVDSIRFTLLFERFLNPARISMPDVDVDFGKVRREEVIEHMRERYGRDHVGQISNFGQFKPKSALKDMLRGLGVNFKDANRLTGNVDDDKATSMAEAVDATPSLNRLVQLDPVFRRAVRLAAMLIRAGANKGDKPDPFLRQRGVHAAGVVVAPRPLAVYAPVFSDAESGRDVLAVDMDGTETLGLIKFDFLGLKTLDVIQEALDHIELQTGARPDLDRVPLDDPEVFALLSTGDVQGLFQVESSGMRQYLQQLQPDHVEDVIAMLALYRPGPLGSGMVEDFIERKRGRQEVVHLHPLLEPVLRATYGVLVYQESILQAAQVLAGYSLGHADLLRRAIGKKKPEEIAAQKVSFVEGCGKNGISGDEARRIFGLIEKFAEYGFNRCLSGSTMVTRAGSNNHGSPDISIKELFVAARSKTPWGVKIRAGRLNLLQMDEDGRVRPGRLVRILEQGIQRVFEVRTESGRLIRATGNHRLLTDAGYLRVDQMSAGTKLIGMGKKEEKPRSGHHADRALGKGYASQKGMPSGEANPGWLDGRHVLFEAAKELVSVRAQGRCETCAVLIPPQKHAGEMAHQRSLVDLDGDYARYHSAENIRLLCNSCHKRLDYQKGERIVRWGRGCPTETDDVVSIVDVGEEETFDLEMEAPNHNFIANGIVSHNSHSAAYGLITYRTAWLKAHHRAAFLAACASWEGDNHEALAKVLGDAQRAGIALLGPDVFRSESRFSVERIEGGKEAIRYGLSAIDGLGDAALTGLAQLRRGAAPADLGGFLRQVGLDRRKVETLAASGALDRYNVRRDYVGPVSRAYKEAVEAAAKAEKKAEKVAAKAAEKAVKKGGGQVSLFGAPAPEPVAVAEPIMFSSVLQGVTLPKEDRWTWQMRLAKEEKAIGVVLSTSPLLRWGDLAPVVQTHTIAALATVPARAPVAIVGRIRSVFTRVTKTGNTMGFVQVVDDTGTTEVTLFSSVLHASKGALSIGAGVVVKGSLDRPGTAGVLIAGSVEELDAIRARGARLIRIGNMGKPLLVPPEEVEEVLLAHPGTCPVRVNGTVHGDWAARLARHVVTPDGALFDDLERTFGAPGVARAIL